MINVMTKTPVMEMECANVTNATATKVTWVLTVSVQKAM